MACTAVSAHVAYAIDLTEQVPLPFDIDTFTGQLIVTQELDFEAQTNFSFQVSCTDILGFNATALVEVELSSVNEFTPEVTSEDVFPVVLTETTALETVVISSLPGALRVFTVVDEDEGEDGEVMYNLVSSLDDHLSFDPVSGSVTLVREFDFETEEFSSLFHQVDVEIVACDRATPPPICPEINTIVYLSGSDEYNTSFFQDLYTAAIRETAPLGSALLTLQCSDIDVGIGAVESIALLNPPFQVPTLFQLDPFINNGSIYNSTLTLVGQLDYDRLNRSYVFYVTCQDTIHNSTALINITILPENDEEPVFQNPSAIGYRFSVSQTALLGSLVGAVFASDDDVDSGMPVRYFVLNYLPFLTIDQVSGQITVNDSITNVTAQSTLFMNVSASDGEFNTYVKVEIYVTPGNFHSPQFLHPNLTVYVNELTMVGEIITILACSDLDGIPVTNITYSLVTNNSLFLVDTTSGNLSVNSSLILPPLVSTITEYIIVVECTDNGLPELSDQALLTIAVFRDDSTPPSLNNITVYITEWASEGFNITVVEANDPDTMVLSFVIVNETVPGTFTLLQMEQQRSLLILVAPLDYEQVAVHHVTVEVAEVRAVPGETQRVRGEVVIVVLNENDNSPQITASPPPQAISDATAVGTTILSVLCTDDDGDNAELSYSITPDSLFTIDTTNGSVSTVSPLTLPPATFTLSHQLWVQCTDSGIPPLSNQTMLSITLYKSDTQPPIILETISTNISEGAELAEDLISVQAYDIDSPALIYHLVNESVPGTFQINETTGVVFLAEGLDRETVSFYSFSVVVEEVRVAPGPAHSSSALVTVKVLDENDNRPSFAAAPHPVAVGDQIANGTIVATVHCEDEDEDSHGEVEYYILPTENLFAVDKNGHVLVAKSLDLPDFILSTSHTLSLHCRDLGMPPLHSEEAVPLTINITKTDIMPPQFNISSISDSLSHPENSTSGSRIAMLTAFDVDSPAVTLTIVNQTVPSTFSIISVSPLSNPNHVYLVLNGSLDRESTDEHTISLLASSVPTSPTTPAQASLLSVTVQVEDVNDNAPNCTTVNVTITEGFYSSLVLFTPSCSDRDTGINQELRYQLNTSQPSLENGNVHINHSSGEVRLEGGIAAGGYLVCVEVSDQGTPQLNNSLCANVVVTEGSEMGQSVRGYVIEVVVSVVLVVLFIVMVCGLFCCYWCNIRRVQRRKSRFNK